MANSPSDDGWQWEQILINPQHFDLEDLEEVRANAVERAKACAKKAFAKGRAAATDWAAAAMNQGAKLAHRWTGRIGGMPQLAKEVISGTSHFCTPVDMMASRLAKWQKTQDSAQGTVTALQEVRACAKAHQDLPKIVLKDVDEALATMNEATGLALVSVSPYLKLEERRLWISSLNVRKMLLGPGRSTSHWFVCSPRRLKVSDSFHF